MSQPRHPKVILKKLGRERAYGYYDGDIYIDPATKGKARLEVLIHEFMHHLRPAYTEAVVTRDSKLLADFLHKHDVRVTEPHDKGLNED